MAGSQRYAFLDVLRGIAVLWMIQVHVTNVFLDPALRSGWFFTVLNISNGFVAPAFIFCAGGGLWIALSRKGESYLSFEKPLWQYLKRLSYILFWAFVLHMPAWSLMEMMDMPWKDLLTGFQVDVLQTIVYSSLVVLATFLITRSLERTKWVMLMLVVLIWGTTALLWQSSALAALPDVVRVMLSPPPTSPFPLMPWSAYLFAGFIATEFFMTSARREWLARLFIAVGFVLPFFIFLLRELETNAPWSDMWWSASPGSQAFRICGIMLTWGVLYLNEERLRSSRIGKFMQEVGTESLFLYLSHLLVVYGQLPSILNLFGVQHTGYAGVAIIWISLTIPVLFFMHWWHWLKGAHPLAARWVLVIQVSWITISLMITPPGFRWQDLIG